ncbi:MAG: hypothetical protein Q7S87_08785 [Agitococcus sp.]|nr:hypothetical protein [Agitococcus sp.]MDO9176994.1 hypothetical protein [Agitococcus sp.]
MAAADGLTYQSKFASLFSYRFFDHDYNVCYLDEGDSPAIGFTLEVPTLACEAFAGALAVDAVLALLPLDSVIQFSKLMAQAAAERPSVGYVTVRLPYVGSLTNTTSLRAFVQQCLTLRTEIQRRFALSNIVTTTLDEAGLKFLLRELTNPHISTENRAYPVQPGIPLFQDIIAQNTRVTIQKNGGLGFTNEDAESPSVIVVVMTADFTPRHLYLPILSDPVHDPLGDSTEISCAYWAYTTVHMISGDEAHEVLASKLGMRESAPLSETAWFRAMTGIAFENNPAAHPLFRTLAEGQRWVRAYTGINLYTDVTDARYLTAVTTQRYRHFGFRVAEEAYVSLPAFIMSLPMQYAPSMDRSTDGLQRAGLIAIAIPELTDVLSATDAHQE